MRAHRSCHETLAALPPKWPGDLRSTIRAAVVAYRRKLVVLDDDPTGTQTVHDLPVLTNWDVDTLRKEFISEFPCFYILTNSRSLSETEAAQLNRQIARNLTEASRSVSKEFVIVSRSDSTLRGHFPAETDALSELLGPVNATILIPYFEAGGRLTINDVHYVVEGGLLVPAAETPFARDAAFGYRCSNLRDWVEEKTNGRIRASSVHSISLDELRVAVPSHEPTRSITVKLLALPNGSVCVVNACDPRDVEFFALASMVAEQTGARFLYRSAASFVSARLGMEPKPLLTCKELTGGVASMVQASSCDANGQSSIAKRGGLIIVGSHVPKTTEQLSRLLSSAPFSAIELSVEAIMDGSDVEHLIQNALEKLETALRSGQDAVLYTSRKVVVGGGGADSLSISAQVSVTLVNIIRRLSQRPRFLLAKGGITSSDLATKALGVKRAMVLGQILPGVPVWRLGEETRFPGLSYVVFPGNVGGADALIEAYRRLNT